MWLVPALPLFGFVTLAVTGGSCLVGYLAVSESAPSPVRWSWP